jgi:hypothetical protein
VRTHFEELRAYLESASVRKATLFLLAGSAASAILEIVFFREGPGAAAIEAFGYFVGGWLVAALGAAIGALPGWLFRGHFRFKPLMAAGSLSVAASGLVALAQTLALNASARLPAVAIVAALSAAGAGLWLFCFLATLAPEGWTNRLGRASLAFAAAIAVGAAGEANKRATELRGESLFNQERVAAAQKAAGGVADFQSVRDEMLAFSAKIERARARSPEIAIFDSPAPTGEFAAGPLAAARAPSSTANSVAAPAADSAAASAAGPASPSAPASAAAPGACQAMQSAPGKILASIKFVNDGPAAATVQWMDFQGVAKPFRTLRAGEFYEQATYLGHNWIVVDGQNRCLGSSAIREQHQELVFKGPR